MSDRAFTVDRRPFTRLASAVTTVTLVLASCVTGLLTASPAHAAYPGANGKIYFLYNEDIYGVDADGTNPVTLIIGSATGRPPPPPRRPVPDRLPRACENTDRRSIPTLTTLTFLADDLITMRGAPVGGIAPHGDQRHPWTSEFASAARDPQR